MKKVWKSGVLPVCLMFLASSWFAAEAATVTFNLASTQVSGFSAASFGTVTVAQDITNPHAIDITLSLNAGYRIHRTQGSQHPAIAFDLAGTPAVSVSGLGGDFTVLPGGSSSAGYGAFPYAIACSGEGCLSGYSDTNYQSLSFVVAPLSSAAALTPASLVSNGSAFFTVDVQTPGGLTGNIASLSPSAVVLGSSAAVPEPGTAPLLGLGLAGMLALGRRPKARAIGCAGERSASTRAVPG